MPSSRALTNSSSAASSSPADPRMGPATIGTWVQVELESILVDLVEAEVGMGEGLSLEGGGLFDKGGDE